ncbi:unnamed protein product [Paramecium octaurelia]|uniref:Uncharacterized protein n=1 Tax=Paramecium octaurelia TaxID=43137 RepID=A0A8S1THJ6_PAROT|nr:unnamed protein product [Paramecium octaurelia]
MPILADLKYQVELQMKKTQSNRVAPSPKEKVMLLTRILYEKKPIKEACEELRMSYAWGKAIWSEHMSQYNKSKKLYKKKNDSPKTPPSETEQITKKVAGVKMLPQGQHISKQFHIQILIHGNPVVSKKGFD